MPTAPNSYPRPTLDPAGKELEGILEHAPDVMARFDREARHLYVSPAVERATGCPPEHFIGRSNEEIGHPPELCKLWRDAIEQVFKSEDPLRITFDHNAPDGRRHFQGLLVPERDRGGEVVSVLSYTRDVTDLKRRTWELGERHKELSCLYAVSDLLEQVGEDEAGTYQKVVDAIPGGWQYPEVTEAELVIDNRRYISSGFRQSPWTLTSNIQFDGSSRGRLTVCYVENPAGEVDPFLAEEHDLLRGLAQRVSSAVRRRRAERALINSEAYFRALIEHASDMTLALDPDGIIRHASPSVQGTLGYPIEELIGHSALDFIHPEDEQRVTDSFDMLGKSRSPVRLEHRCRHRDGSWRIIESIESNLLGEAAVEAIVINSRDVTEQREAEIERQRLAEHLRQAQKLEAIGQLAGGIAHDFNNLLTAIIASAEALDTDLPAGSTLREDTDQIREAAVRAASLTRQLLAFSRRQVLKPEALNLNETISHLEKMVSRLIGEDVRVRTHLEPTLGHIEADPGQIEQVIINLLVNARDAMPGGGTIDLATRSVELDSSEVGDLPAGSYVVLSVADSGPGIPEQQRGRVFEPFFTTKPEGTGLGLATVYGIVKQSGGHVWVESTAGKGATFHVCLPLAQGRPRSKPPDATERPAAASGGEKVLVVEDDPAVRAVTTRVLRRAGYQVEACASAYEATRAIEQQGVMVDLLLTDVVMPDKSGLELADDLRERHPGLRVLFMSGYSSALIALRGLDPTELDLLQKPYSNEALVRRVRCALEVPELSRG